MKVYLYVKALLNAFRKNYKKVSLYIKLRVVDTTGEVSECYNRRRYCEKFITGRDGRGFVLPVYLARKEPKYLINPVKGQIRLYITSCITNSLEPIQDQQVFLPPPILKGLEIIAKHSLICYESSEKRVFPNLRGIIKQESLWYLGYLSLISNKGFNTFVRDAAEILNSWTKKRIKELRDRVLNNEFSWREVREQVNSKSSKPGKFLGLPLGMPGINDRLVQEVIHKVVEPVFEPKLSDKSYGFRPNRSIHKALECINTNMEDSVWFMKGNLKSSNSIIDKGILIKLVRKRIQDPLILRLIKTGLEAKVFQEDYNETIIPPPSLDIPQIGILSLSPLFFNIYLDVFDKYMEELSSQYLEVVKASKIKNNPTAIALKLLSGNKEENNRLIIPSKIHNKVENINCKYLRYGENFIIGIIGPRSIAFKIRDKVKEFLKNELNIELSLDKTRITHIRKEIDFLDDKLGRKSFFVQTKFGSKVIIRKIMRPILDIEMKKVIACLAQKGFCDGNGRPLPNSRYLRILQNETNIKVGNKFKFFFQFSSITDNLKKIIALVAYILKYSIAKTYAGKFKLSTVSRVFKIGSNYLSKPVGARKNSVIGADESKQYAIWLKVLR